MFLGLEELLDVREQDVTGRKQTSAEPQQLPALLLTVPAHTPRHKHTHQLCQKNRTLTTVLLKSCLCVCVSCVLYVIIGELLEDLTEDLVLERLGLQRSFKDQICELVD